MHELDASDVSAWLLETEVTEVVRVNKNGEPQAVIVPYELLCAKKGGESLPCCIKDESRPLGFGDQKLESNRPMRLL